MGTELGNSFRLHSLTLSGEEASLVSVSLDRIVTCKLYVNDSCVLEGIVIA